MVFPLATETSSSVLYSLVPFLDSGLAFLSLLLAHQAGKLYKLSGKDYHKYFYYAVIFLALGLMSAAMAEFYVLNEVVEGKASFDRAIYSCGANDVANIGMMGYNIFLLIGYLLLALMFYARDEHIKSEYALPALIPLWHTCSLNFHLFFSVILVYVAFKQWGNYFSNKTKFSLIASIFMTLLLAHHIGILMSAKFTVFFVIAYLMYFIAFLILLEFLRSIVFTRSQHSERKEGSSRAKSFSSRARPSSLGVRGKKRRTRRNAKV